MDYRRKSPWFLALLAAASAAFGASLLHARLAGERMGPRLEGNRRLAEGLGLTDLCLFTDARYTRHSAVADVHSAFQDYPLSFEHFPSGSLVGPPPHLTGFGRADGRD
jgi:hypothetical protein